MSDHDVEALAQQIEALKMQLENLRRGLWGLVVVILVPGVLVLVTFGTQLETISGNEERSKENAGKLETQGLLAAGQAAQLSGIAKSIGRVERLLERQTQERN